MKRWYSYLIMFLLVLGVLEYYLLPKMTGPLHLDMIWKTHNKQSGASVPKGQDVPEEILALRRQCATGSSIFLSIQMPNTTIRPAI